MRKTILFNLLVIIFSVNSYAQIGPYDKPSYSTFTPLTQKEILMPALIMKQRYDNNAAKVDALIQYILDLKEQTNDKEFLATMDNYYDELMKFYDFDLANMDKEIRKAKFIIQEEVNKYNRRIKNQNEIANNQNISVQKDLSKLRGYQKTYDLSPILEEPNVNAKELGKVKNQIVEIIALYDKNFYKVRSGGIEGYLWIGWFK